MERDVTSSIIIFVLLVSNSVQGYFYRMHVIDRVIDGNTGHKQRIILLGDYHDKKHPANKKHRDYLDALLQKCCLHKSKLIIEDLSSMNNDGKMFCCHFGINCVEGILGQLAHKARILGICVDNVEFRYCRVASIGPLINNLKADPYSFKSTATITLMALYKEIIDEIEKIAHYEDGMQLNAFYKQVISEVRNIVSKMKLPDVDKKKTVAEYCVQLNARKYRQELEKLCIFDSALIDINIMHSIHSGTFPLVIVVAGGSHIEQVSKLLKKIGCKTIFSAPLHATAQPLDLSMLDEIIH